MRDGVHLEDETKSQSESIPLRGRFPRYNLVEETSVMLKLGRVGSQHAKRSVGVEGRIVSRGAIASLPLYEAGNNTDGMRRSMKLLSHTICKAADDG